MEIGFAEALLLVGALIAAAAALSGLTGGTVLSISILSVGAGVSLELAGVISIEPDSEVVLHIVELALVMTLFSDGLLVEREILQRHWGPPTRALAAALPITLVLIALAAKLLFPELTWAEAFLLGAVLSPTDPVISSVVVAAKGVPERLRHTLNLESGLNDGLVLPLVLILLALSEPGGESGGFGAGLLGESLAGAVIGAAIGYAGAWVAHRAPRGGIASRYEGVYALGVALLCFAIAEVIIGNGLIAAFVGGLAMAIRAHEMPEAFAGFSENLSSILQVITFVLFGALVITTGYDASVPGLVVLTLLTLLVARPVAIGLAFLRSSMPRVQVAFLAWFGPKGVASILFALYVLNSHAPDRTLVFDLAAFVVLASIVAHGLTDTVGARWMEERLKSGEDRDEEHEPLR